MHSGQSGPDSVMNYRGRLDGVYDRAQHSEEHCAGGIAYACFSVMRE